MWSGWWGGEGGGREKERDRESERWGGGYGLARMCVSSPYSEEAVVVMEIRG